MLYFTLWNEAQNEIRAIYNGKSAFIPGAQIEDIQTSSENEIGELKELIDHEHDHQKIFRHSKAGRALIAHRFVARFRFLVLQDTMFLRRHYIARTLFYLYAYGVHEQLVDAENNSIDTKKLIKHADELTHRSWEHYGLFNKYSISLYLYSIVGILYNKSYSIPVHRAKADDSLRQDWVVSNVPGVPKDILGVRIEESRGRRYARKFLDQLRLEKLLPRAKRNNCDTDWRWLWEKIRTERVVCYQELKRMKDAEESAPRPIKVDFDAYVSQIVRFAESWVLGLNSSDALTVFQSIDQIRGKFDLNRAKCRKPAPFIQGTRGGTLLNFFYLHGN